MVCVMAVMTFFQVALAVYAYISVAASYRIATNGQSQINPLKYFKHGKAGMKLGKHSCMYLICPDFRS